MEKEKARLKKALRDHGNDKVNRAAVDYVKAVEKTISQLEMDELASHFAIRRLRFDLNLILDAMTAYGIDLGKLGSYHRIMSDVDLSQHGIYKKPEKWN